MRNNIRYFVLSVVFILCITPVKLNAGLDLPFDNPEIKISMDFQDANLKDILKIFSIQSGLNFIASEGVQERSMTLYLDKVGIKEAMDKLFKANNLAYELDKESNIFIVKDLGKLGVDTVTKVFYLKYATVTTSSIKEEMSNVLTSTSGFGTGSESSSSGGEGGGESGKWKTEDESGITSSVKKLLSEYGSVVEDFRTNSLVVTDTPSRMKIISEVIASLDVAVTQVLLEVEMLDVNKNSVDKIGFDWSGASSFSFAYSPASRLTSFPFGNRTPQDGIGTGKLTPGKLTPGGLTLVFDFLRTLSDTKFLARPRILTLNNETAEIKVSTNESIGVKTTTTETSGSIQSEPERTETGIILRVTPQVDLDTGQITMFLHPKVAEAVEGNPITSGGETFEFRDPEERSTKSIIRVKDGETVIIGGLIRNDSSLTETKLPVLGDIPLLGSLFRHKDKTRDRQRELLIFITPRIIKDTATTMKLAQTNTPVMPASAAAGTKFLDREQSLQSAIDRQAVIKSSLNVFEK